MFNNMVALTILKLLCLFNDLTFLAAAAATVVVIVVVVAAVVSVPAAAAVFFFSDEVDNAFLWRLSVDTQFCFKFTSTFRLF